MDEKPIVNIRRFQSPKMKGKYLIKFGLYILVFISLWFWYKNQTKVREDNRKVQEKIMKSDTLELKGIKIEP